MRRLIIAFVAVVVLASGALELRAAQAGEVPHYTVDASWPKQLPHNWIMGQVGGMTVDPQDHIWVNQRPRTLTSDEKGATLDPPESKCCAPAPPVMEFDQAGNLIQAWGGPGA